VIERGVLIGPERLQVSGRSMAGHGNELLPGDETAALPQRNQLPDAVAVTGDGKGLPVLDGIHDLPRFRPEVALGDLWVSTHPAMVAPRAIWCYQRAQDGGTALLGRPDFLVRADLLAAPDGEPRQEERHYEVVDAKLARTAKARAVAQTAFYSRLLAALQGVRPAGCTWRSAGAT